MLSSDAKHPIFDAVPPRYRAAHDDRPEVVQAIREQRWVVFSGPNGRGKSYAMASAASEFGACGWLDWPEFLTDIRTHWRMRTDDAAKFDPMAWATHYAPPLFVDDVGAETDEIGVEKFQAVVNHRYNLRLVLVITTNLGVAEIETRYGKRSASRIAECALWVPMTGPDLRLAGHA